MQTQSEFFLANQDADGNLTPTQSAYMLGLPEGDIPDQTGKSGEPDAPAVTDAPEGGDKKADEPKADDAPADTGTPAADTQPVVLAKDGVHTIPFDTLVAHREGEKHWKTIAEQQAQELEALKKGAPAPAPAAPAPGPAAPAAPEPIKLDLGDLSDEAVSTGLSQAVDAHAQRLEAKLEAKLAERLDKGLAPVKALEQDTQTAALAAHFKAIGDAHPDWESVVESAELTAWAKTQPTFAQAAIKAVLEQGTAPQVVELLDTFKAQTRKTEPPAPPPPAPAAPAVDPKAAAQAVIAAAKTKPPTSLTEVPSGGVGQADEATAMLEMSGTSLMAKFANLTPEQIRDKLAKVL